MIRLDNTMRYMAINVITGENTGWAEDIYDLHMRIAEMLSGGKYPKVARYRNDPKNYMDQIKRRADMEPEAETFLVYKGYPPVAYKEMYYRSIRIVDSCGRTYMPEAYADMVIHDIHLQKPFMCNRKKELRQKDSGYRSEPVSRTGKQMWMRKYGRKMSYKHTLSAACDDQCMEYEIKPCREKTRLNAYNIEPFEHADRCWKSSCKVKRQWMIHKAPTDCRSIRYMRPENDINYDVMADIDIDFSA